MRIILSIIICFIVSINSFSQRTCGSVEKMNSFLSKNINYKIKRDKLEKKISEEKIPVYKQSMSIPVVFHVLYNTPIQNISDAQILSQLEVMNNDFNRTNSDAFQIPSDFNSIVSSMQINFCLAKRTPENNPTTGIIRKYTNITSFNLYDTSIHYNNMGGSDAWDTKRYLNIWITNIEGGILGWGQFPDAGSIYTDGVVVDYRHFGTLGTAISPYNLGRTTTHELGHYFNLFHLWGDNYCGDDLVNDTPVQEEANFGCKNHPSISCNNNGDMFMNFMDYSDDACMNSFTIGQRNRVWSSISNYRPDLINQIGCDEITNTTSDASIEIVYPISEIDGCNNPIYPEVKITNKSSQNLYTAVIKYKINSSNYQYQYWSGNLLPQQSTSILLSGLAIGGSSHIIDVELISPNNTTDINLSNNTDTKLFQTSSGTSVNINLFTDNYANENSWILLDENNNEIDSEDSLINNFLYTNNYCLEDACYKLIINDTEGDGICCNYGNGYLTINKELNNIEISSITSFSYSDTVEFCISALSIDKDKKLNTSFFPNPSNGIIKIKNDNFTFGMPIFAEVFNLEGKLIEEKESLTSSFKFNNLNQGIYILKLTQNEYVIFNKMAIN